MPAPRVFIVDGDLDELDRFGDALTAAGFAPVPWSEATLAASLIGTLHPDAVVLDATIARPGDGLSILGALRADPEMAAIPVVLLHSRSGTVDDLSAIVAMRADIVLVRPVTAEQLVNGVRIATEPRS